MRVRDVMTTEPVTVPGITPLTEVARRMRDDDIGDVLVVDEGRLVGILTDRDLVVRSMAVGRDPGEARAVDVCSGEVVTVSPDDDTDHAIELMRFHAVRRLPVIEDDSAVGIVSLGDLAVERDVMPAIADISADTPTS